ncbi:Heterokaryon incompatibility protein (HET) domain containing protein [Rhypophila decipiens]
MPRKRLNAQNREIRLATLYPRNRQSSVPSASSPPNSPRIQLSLRHVSLNDSPPPQYTALSYVWGNPAETVPTLVDGVEFLATKNLVAALAELQPEDGDSMTLWIDALCINQSDNDEKSGQIQLMKQIYEASACTIVWLGDDADGSEAVQAAISESKMTDETRAGDSELVQVGKLMLVDPTIPTDSSHPALLSTQASFSALLNREYWFRVWCLQEVSVSNEAVVACGRDGHKIDVDAFGKTVHYYIKLMGVVINQAASKGDLVAQVRTGSPYWPSDFAIPINGATRMLDQRKKYRGVQRQQDHDGGTDVRPNSSHPTLLHYLIDAYASVVEDVSLQSTDPRDMIYGLMNLACDVEELDIVPDYQKPCEQVFTETWAAIMRKHGANMLVWAVPESFQLSCDPQGMLVPSWVPDWRQPRQFHVLLQSGLFQACGEKHQETQWVSTDDPRIIALRGVQVDIIQEVGSPLSGPKSDMHSIGVFIDEITQFLETSSLLAPSPEKSVYPTPEANHSARWRIPLCDIEGTAIRSGLMNRATSGSEESFQSALAVLEGLRQAPAPGVENGIENWSAMLEVTLGQHLQGLLGYSSTVCATSCSRPFLTSRGWVGRGPAGMKAGDVVVILWGCRLPIVLRPCGGDADDQKYQLVGDAYVHGLMDGEFVQGDVKTEERTFQLC